MSLALHARLEGSGGLRTLNERMRQMEPQVHQMREQPITSVSAVVPLDGMWVTIQGQGEQSKPDRRRHSRKQRTGHKMVILVTPGIWEDGTRDILDWQRTPCEEHTQWESVLKQLRKRGGQPETGRTLMVRDGSGG